MPDEHADTAPLLEARQLTRSFGPILALDRADLDIAAGEVLAICGENGAGKSTLMKILAGAEEADEGIIRLRGETVRFQNAQEAARHGVSIVFQELSLFPDIDILTNIAADSTPSRFGILDRRRMMERAAPVLHELGIDGLDLDVPVGTCSLGDRQLLEIAKALLNDSSVLILDEPNSALNQEETERLFEVIGNLRERGVAILYVSHRLEEVFRISDRIVIMVNGRTVMNTLPRDTSIAEVVRVMIGRDVSDERATGAAGRQVGAVVAAFSAASGEHSVQDATFDLHRGEVLGVAGLAGSGAIGLFDLLFGLERARSGQLRVNGKPVDFRSPYDAVAAGVARVPSDRRAHGLMLEKSILDNIALVTAGALGRHGKILQLRTIRSMAEDLCRQLSVKAQSTDILAGQLSGGNQQKVVIAKWLAAAPDLILLDDPTRGIDVGAKAEIYKLVRAQADTGKAILFRSSEMIEYEMTCDRVLIVRNGRIVGQLEGEGISEHALLEGINAA